MMNAIESSGRPLMATVVVSLVAAVLTTVIGVSPAIAAAKEVSFVASSSITPEGSPTNVGLRLTSDEALTTAVTATVTAVPGATGDAAELADFTLSPTTVTFPIGSDNGEVLLVPLSFTSDSIFENAETIDLTIVLVTGGSIGAITTHTATIFNDDSAPTLAISDASATEADGSMVFTVTRSGLTELATTAVASPTGDTATAVSDFGAAAQVIDIAPGGATGSDTLAVNLVNDNVYEATETFNVTLSALDNASEGGSDLNAVGSIDDDEPPPTVSINSVSITEANGTATFTITRSGLTDFDATVDVKTSPLGTEVGKDYTTVSTTVTILKGGSAATTSVVVPIVDDDIDEDDETFQLTLSDPVHATLDVATGIGTIIDNDTAGITVDLDDNLFVLEGDTPDTFTLALKTEPTANVTVAVASADGQVNITPGSRVFTPTNWATPQTFTVTAVEDGIDEDDPHRGTITITATSTDSKYQGVKAADVIAIVGDADALLVTVDGPSVGAPGNPVTFTTTVNAGATGDITYQWTAFYLGNAILSGTQSDFTFTPVEGGPYIVQVIVGDDEGQNPADFVPFRALADLAGSVFVNDIVWLAENEITRGCNPPINDRFCPTDVVTRGQMAAFLVRALGLTDDGGGNTFTDDDNSIFETDIAKIATAGITKGCNPPTNDRFCPTAPVTREQMAAFIHRAAELGQ